MKYSRSPVQRRAFAYLKDVMTQFATSDIPPGTRAEQPIRYLRGSIYINIGIARPRDLGDADFNPDAWANLVPFAAVPVFAIHSALGGMHEANRDQHFEKRYGGGIAAKWCNSFQLVAAGENFDADFTLASQYRYNKTVRVDFAVPSDRIGGLTRARLQSLKVYAPESLLPGSIANVTGMSITYGTDYFEQTVTARMGTDDLVDPETGESDTAGATGQFPLSRWEQINQRDELTASANELVDHLNEHIEYYHKAVWWSMDRDRLHMLLDGFYVPGTNGVSIASVVDREPMGIIGNALVYRVSPGAFLGLGDVQTPADLHNLYADNQPPSDPLLVSLPSDGLYAQSILDECQALEEHFGNRDWVLNDKDPELGGIDPALLASRRAEPTGEPKPTPLPATIVNLQNAPDAPAPSGLADVLNAVTKADSFRDMAGLSATQANALGALQAAAGLATSFGNHAAALAATELAAKAHATQTADQKLSSVRRAQSDGLISSGEASRQASEILRETHTPKSTIRPHQEQPIIAAIGAATNRPGSVIEANTAEGQVKVAIGSADGIDPYRQVDIIRNQPWAFEADFLVANFDVASSELKTPHKNALLDLVEYLAERTSDGAKLKIRSITGHASNTGPEGPAGSGFVGNYALSQARAEKVRTFLSDNGLREGELPTSITPRGSLDPVVPTLLGVEHPLNRSVRIRFALVDLSKAAAYRPGFQDWELDLSASMLNMSGELKALAADPRRPISGGLKVGGKLDLGRLTCLDAAGAPNRDITLFNGFVGLGIGLSIPDEFIPDVMIAGRPLKTMIQHAVNTLIGMLGVSVSGSVGGRFRTYTPVDFDYFDGRFVIMLQSSAVAMAGGEQALIAILDPDAPNFIAGVTYMLGVVASPLSFEASSTLHLGLSPFAKGASRSDEQLISPPGRKPGTSIVSGLKIRICNTTKSTEHRS
ncbi:MAG: OmpA family protein [Verrucomicrobia bacterium]|nr:OmpA family protein [Verrucomicrobiota bacterium]